MSFPFAPMAIGRSQRPENSHLDQEMDEYAEVNEWRPGYVYDDEGWVPADEYDDEGNIYDDEA